MDPERDADETGRNPTQERIDEEGAEPRPVDVDWDDPGADEREREPDPAA